MSDELALGIRSQRQPFLPQELPRLVQDLLIDDLPPRPELPLPPSDTSLGSEGGLPSVVLPLAPAASLSVRSGLASATP